MNDEDLTPPVDDEDQDAALPDPDLDQGDDVKNGDAPDEPEED